MKKIYLFIGIFVLSVCAAACGKSTLEKWQEQYDLGMRYLEEQNYEEAIVAFTAAIEIDPQNADAYFALADVYDVLGDKDSLLTILERGAKVTGDNEFNMRLSQINDKGNSIEENQLNNSAKNVLSDLLDEANVIVSKPDNITFFGTPINSLTIEMAEALLTENGFPSSSASGKLLDVITESGDKKTLHRRRSQTFDMSISVVQDNISEYVTYISYYNWNYSKDERIPTNIGICDIYTEDTMNDVLQKLGFPSSNEIVKELEKTGTSNSISSTTETGLKYEWQGNKLKLYFTEANNTYLITFEFNSESIPVLSDCTIYIGK